MYSGWSQGSCRNPASDVATTKQKRKNRNNNKKQKTIISSVENRNEICLMKQNTRISCHKNENQYFSPVDLDYTDQNNK